LARFVGIGIERCKEMLMDTPASIAKHPIHPMLVTIPIGLWIFSLVCDAVSLFAGDGEIALAWAMLAYYTIAGGLVGALLAAIPGLIDFLSLRNRRLHTLAATHMGINLAVVALYAVNLWTRTTTPANFLLGAGLSLLGVVLIGISGWIGAEMVHVHGIGVAGVPAPADEIAERQSSHRSPSGRHYEQT
jgi:uncharacterized membrane protein